MFALHHVAMLVDVGHRAIALRASADGAPIDGTMSRTVRPRRRSPEDRRDPEDRRRLALVKKLVTQERRRLRGFVPPLAGEAIPISVRTYGTFISYAASPEDLRAVISRLPPGAAMGLSEIELCLDQAPDDDAEGNVDPFVGFLRQELAPGIFASSTLGQYAPHLSKIQLFGYAYDASRTDRCIIDIYLRLRMLSTFVHEIAHHVDHTTRSGRRQWRTRVVEEREAYADAMKYVWTQDCVVPYLLETYPAEVAELTRWLDVHGGCSLSLSFLAGEPLPGSPVDIDVVFMALLGAVTEGMRAPASQVMFADALQRCGYLEVARKILERVLVEHPGHPKAFALRAKLLRGAP